MTDYRRFTEHNEWEGETWSFYIPVDGNVETLDALAALIAKYDPDAESFEMPERVFTEEEVDLLVEWGDASAEYMAGHNKLSGKLGKVPAPDDLYKGGIRDHMFVDAT